MPRSRRGRRIRNRDDAYYYEDYAPRRRGPLAALSRFFTGVVTFFLVTIGAILLFCILLLIVFNFTVFTTILTYALFVAGGLAVLGILYLAIRTITAISQRLSQASIARAHAKQEQQKAMQARVQVQGQQFELARKKETVAVQQQARDFAPASEAPRRTRVLSLPAEEDASSFAPAWEDPHRMHVLPPGMETPASVGVRAASPGQQRVFYYRDYQHQIQPGQLIIGIRPDGTARIGSWQDFKITLILGASSSGKSTTVLEKCLCLVESGGQLVICDPGGFKPDSLIQRLGPLQHARMPGTTLALEHADIMKNVERFRVELERRRRGADMTTPLLLVVDELNGLLMDKDIKKELTELLEKFAQQARGYNMFMVLCAQRASGLAAIRNSVISFVCHKCPEMEAAKILPSRYAKLAPQLGIGQSFVSDANGFIEALQQIFISPEDIAAARITHIAPPGTLHHRTTEPIAPHIKRREARMTDDLAPQKPLTIPPRQPASASWGDLPAEEEQRRQYGAASRLHKTRLVQQPPPSRTIEPFKETPLRTADGSADDTVLVPATPLPTLHYPSAPTGPASNTTSVVPLPEAPTPQGTVPGHAPAADQFARLAHLRKRKPSQPKI